MAGRQSLINMEKTIDWKEQVRKDYAFLEKDVIDSTIAYWQKILDAELASHEQAIRREVASDILEQIDNSPKNNILLGVLINALRDKYLPDTEK